MFLQAEAAAAGHLRSLNTQLLGRLKHPPKQQGPSAVELTATQYKHPQHPIRCANYSRSL